MNQYFRFFIIVILGFFFHGQAFSLTISNATSIGIKKTYDCLHHTTIFSGENLNSILNNDEIMHALSIGHVKIEDAAAENIIINEKTTIDWSTPYNLIINAPRHLYLKNGVEITSSDAGNLILRADIKGNNDGMVLFETTTPVINMSGGGSVKIYSRQKDVIDPRRFNAFIHTGKMTSYSLINDLNDLQNMSRNLATNYALATDIDASSALFSPIGNINTAFSGEFDGQGFSINNLSIYLPNYDNVGLFGTVSATSLIKNVRLVNVNIIGRNYVGGLIGRLNTSATRSYVSNVFVSGTTTGRDYVGGLIGGTTGTSTSSIDQSFTEGEVIGLRWIGGLVGDTSLSINNCYSTAKISMFEGGNNLGGLIGFANTGTYRNSYAAGVITPVGNSGGLIGSSYSTCQNMIWDLQTTNHTNPAGGRPTLPGTTGLYIFQMRQKASFPGWDFNTVWGIDENESYPYLMWTKEETKPWTTIINNKTGQSELVK